MPTIVNWDWRPAVFEASTRRAAAILKEVGPWAEVDAEDVARTGRVMSDEVCKRTFGELPPLPSWLYVPNRSEAELAPIRAAEDERRRLYAAARAQLGPEWAAVLSEAAKGGRPPQVHLKSNKPPDVSDEAGSASLTSAPAGRPSNS